MRWKIVTLVLLATLVGMIWGTFVYSKLPANAENSNNFVEPIPSLQSTTVGNSRIGVAPRIISYQGYLKDSSSGQPVSDGSRTAVFSLYTSDSGGSTVWQETKTIVTSSGVFRTILGETYPINPSIVSVPELWLGVRLPPDAEMTPRQRIAGSVYSVGATEAQVADTVSTSPDQIAQRKWYGLNRARPPRIDVAWGLAPGNWPATHIDDPDGIGTEVKFASPVGYASSTPYAAATYPEPSIFQPVTALVSPPSKYGTPPIIASVGGGLFVTMGTQQGQFARALWVGASCYSITSLEIAIVCATDTELIISHNFEPGWIRSQTYPSDWYRFQRVLCSGCRHTAYDGLNLWATSYTNGVVYKVSLEPTYELGASSSFGPSSLEPGRAYPFPKDPEIVATYAVGNSPLGVEFDGAKVWIANEADDTVSVLNASTGALVATISVGDSPSKVLFDGSSVWVLNKGDDTVTKIGSESLNVFGTFAGGNASVDISFDGSKLWIANEDDDTITRLKTTDGSVVDTLDLSGSPHLLQFDGQGTWVATTETQPTVQNTYSGSRSSPFSITGERWFITRY